MMGTITPVNTSSVPAGTPQDVAASQLHSSKRIKHVINSTLDWSSATLKIVFSVGKFFNNITPGLKLGLTCTKIPNILLAPSKARNLNDNLKKIVRPGGLFFDRVRAGLKSITNLDELASATSALFKIFIAAKLISDTLGCWIPYFDIVTVFVGPINIGLKGESVINLYKFRRELNSLIKDAKTASPSDIAKKWDNVLARVEEEKVEELRKKLSISKKADLATRVATLRTALQTPGDTTKAVEKSALLMQILAPRVTKQFGYELAELVNKVAVTAGQAFVAFTPFFVVGAAILLTTAVTSLVLMAGRAMLIHKNPFDEYSRSRAEALLDFLIPSRKEALSLRKKVQELSDEKEKAQRCIKEQATKIQYLEAKIPKTNISEQKDEDIAKGVNPEIFVAA